MKTRNVFQKGLIAVLFASLGTAAHAGKNSWGIGFNTDAGTTDLNSKIDKLLATKANDNKTISAIRIFIGIRDKNDVSAGRLKSLDNDGDFKSDLCRKLDSLSGKFNITLALSTNQKDGQAASALMNAGSFASLNQYPAYKILSSLLNHKCKDGLVKDLIDQIEIGNEPNAKDYWPSSNSWAAQYMKYYLRPASAAIRAAKSDLPIVSGGITGNRYEALQDLIDEGLLKRSDGKTLVDYVGIHPYPSTVDALKTEMTKIRKLLDDNDMEKMPLACTEWSIRPSSIGKGDFDPSNEQSELWAQANREAAPTIQKYCDLAHYFAFIQKFSQTAGKFSIYSPSLSKKKHGAYDAFMEFRDDANGVVTNVPFKGVNPPGNDDNSNNHNTQTLAIPTIKKVEVVDGLSGAVLATLPFTSASILFDVSQINAKTFNIRATVDNNEDLDDPNLVRSVTFTFDGSVSVDSNGEAYAFNDTSENDLGRDIDSLTTAIHTLKIQAKATLDGSSKQSATQTFTLNVVRNGNNGGNNASTNPSIQSIGLWDMAADKEIAGFESMAGASAKIWSSQLPVASVGFNVRGAKIAKLSLSLDGIKRTFGLAGSTECDLGNCLAKIGGYVRAATPAFKTLVGVHTLSISAFSTSDKLITKTFVLNVQQAGSPTISKIMLMNGATFSVIEGYSDLNNTETLDLSALKAKGITKFYIQAIAANAQSVRLSYDQRDHLESNEFYELYDIVGGKPGNHLNSQHAGDFKEGLHTLVVTPYSLDAGQGASGARRIVKLKIVE